MLNQAEILNLPLLEVVNPPFVISVLTKGMAWPWLDCFEKRRTTWMYKKFRTAYPNTQMTLREYLSGGITKASLVDTFGRSTADHFVSLMEKLEIDIPSGEPRKGHVPSKGAQDVLDSL